MKEQTQSGKMVPF